MIFNKYKKLKAQKKIKILAILIPLISAIFIYLIFIPTIDKINTTKEEIINQKIELQKNITQQKNINKLNSKLQKIEPKIHKLDKTFLNKNRELEFITTFENIAQSNNINQDININIDQQKNNNTEYYDTVKILINASGTFQNIVNYINDIETLNYYINISNISISNNNPKNSILLNSPENFENIEIININIEANTFWK